jgi:TP901 family phage tail tape measure protein
MADNDVTIRFTGDEKNLTQSIGNVSSEFEKLSKSGQSAQLKVQEAAKKTAEAQIAAQAKVQAALERSYALQVQKAVQAAEKAAAAQISAQAKARVAAEKAAAAIANAQANPGVAAEKAAAKAVAAAEKAAQAQIKAQEKASQSAQKLAETQTRIAEKQGIAQAKEAEKAAKAMEKSQIEAFKNIEAQSQKSSQEIASGMRSIGAAAAATSAVIGGIFLKGTQEFIGLDKALRQSAVVAGATTEEAQGLREEVERLGIVTSKTPKEVAETSIALSRAGFSAQETTAALEGIVQASEATAESLGTVGDITAKAIRAFGLAASDSGKIADLLTVTSNRTNTSVSTIGESLAYVSATAAGADQPLEDVLITIGLLGDAGIQGSSAGTGLAAALDRLKIASAAGNSELAGLARGSAKAAEAMQVIGANVRDAEGNMLPLTQIIPQVQAGLSDLSKEDQDIVFKALFGVQGGKTFQTLINTAPERVNAVTDAVRNAEGAAGVASEKLLQGLGGAIDLFEGSLGSALSKVGEFSANGVEPLVRSATSLLNAFLALPAPIQQVIIATTGLAGVLASAVGVLAAYNIAINSQIASEIKLAAITIKNTIVTNASTVATKASASAKLIAAAATGKLTAAQNAALISAGKLALTLGAIALAVEGVSAAVNKYGATKFTEQTDSARKALEEFTDTAIKSGDAVNQRVIEPYRSFIDIVGLRAKARINQSKIAIGEFSKDIYANVDAIQASAQANGDLAERQKLYETTLKSTQDAIANLDEKMLGTEAYNEQKAQLEITEKLLINNAGAWGVLTQEQQKNVAESAKLNIEEQTKALEQQIDVLKERSELEKSKAQEDFQKSELEKERTASEEKIKREREAGDAERARQKAFDDSLAAAQLANEDALNKIKDQRTQEDIQFQQQSEQALEDIKDKRTLERDALKKQSDDEIETLKDTRSDARDEEKKRFEESLETFKDNRTAERESSRKKFDEEIESLKDQRSQARADIEKNLADQIAARLDQQAASFSQAGLELSRTQAILAADSEEERQKIAAKFEKERQQSAAVAALDLANKVFSPDELLRKAQAIAGVQSVKTEEDAIALQQTLSLIENEQKKQQAEADKIATAALAEEQRQIDLAFEAELESRKVAFDEQQRQSERDLATELETRQAEFDLKQKETDRAFEDEIEAKQSAFDLQQRDFDKETENQVQALENQFEQEKIARDIQRREQDKLFAIETEKAIADAQAIFDEQQRTAQEQFADSERAKDQQLEDDKRAREAAFNEAERQKDLATARQIAEIESRRNALTAALNEPDLEEPIARKTGGAVVPGQTYLVGERNPEPVVFNDGSMKVLGQNAPELVRFSKSGVIYPSMSSMPTISPVLRSPDGEFTPLLTELRKLNRAMKPSVANSNNVYNIVGAQNPVTAAIQLQREQLRAKSRAARL